ncbi:hypothetical protein GGH92_004773 [Coemansia sp. RSA 2673]|nr:hypothetical protein GGH92_004773 [Coemansia sp. RSA 2673]
MHASSSPVCSFIRRKGPSASPMVNMGQEVKRYLCNKCGYESDTYAESWEHYTTMHP